jgi:flagellin-like hook-associated protein FlgL
MEKHYIISISNLVDTFSRALAGKEFDFTLSTSESSLSDSTISEDDFLLVSIDDKVYYQFKVIDKTEEEIRLKKIFEIEKSISYNIDEDGFIQKITEQEFNTIRHQLFSGFNSLDSISKVNNEFDKLRDEFINWFIDRDGNSHNYFSGQFSSSSERLILELEKTEEVYEEEFDSKIFSTDDGDIESLIKRLENNLSKNEGLFYEYSSGKSNHRPRAIIGKNNYIKFLYEKLEGKQKIASQTKKINITSNQIDFDIKSFQVDCKRAGLVYTDKLITRFVSSLLTKPFVILTGLSGSGKTKLAQAYVQWICQEESQYRIIPVGADWTNREPLLGYPNALKPEEYVKPDSGVIDLILQANSNPELPHFLILDEMNLSHVERYFADFLSVMESNEEIPLYAEGTVDNGVPSKLRVPANLFIIGTVNIDETTNMFSPKVLDRANTIEFRIDTNEMEGFLDTIKDLNMKALLAEGANMAKNFIRLSSNKSFAMKDKEEINTTLLNFFGELQKTGAEFGYRSASEILRLINQLDTLNNKITTSEKIDIAIMQKLLPKLHGSRRKLSPILETLGSFCLTEDLKVVKDVFDKDDFDYSNDKVIYPLSLEKIARMYKGAIDNGFASYAEA